MRISSKSRYATIALMDIAARDGNTPVTLADIFRANIRQITPHRISDRCSRSRRWI